MRQAQVAIDEKPSRRFDPFEVSDALFAAFKAKLQGSTAMAMTHSELEQLVQSEGMPLLRQLLQDHLALRAQRERDFGWMDVTPSDGIERPHQRDSARSLETVFGEVRVARLAYGNRATTSLHPLDAELNLPANKYSLGLCKRVATEAVRGSFDDVVKTVAETTGAHVAKRQVEQIVQSAACDFDAYYAEKQNQRASDETDTAAINVISADAKGVVMRHDDLRPETKRKAEREAPTLKHHVASGEKPNRKRMAEVAAVYSIAPFVRKPEDIVREYRGGGDGPLPKRPRPENKRVWAHLDRPEGEVIEEAFIEALHRDPERAKQWVGLVDGSRSQLDAMRRLAKQYMIPMTIIIDVMHLLDYLWKAAAVFVKAGTQEAENWVTERLFDLLCGAHPGHVAAGIRRSATKRGLSQKQRQAADKCADYIIANAEFMHYGEYIAKGLPIATGVIEGACRHLIADRMDITGARWRLKSAEAVLRLRALRANGDFDDYWRFHQRQELQRNHAPLYANGVPVPKCPARRPRLTLVP